MGEDIRNIRGDKPVIGGGVDGARGSDAVDTLQKGGGVGEEDADALVAVFLEVIA